jgi:PmbA protein
MIDILDRLSTQSDQAEVVYFESESTNVGFEANRLKSSQVEETKGVAVRIVKDGRLGFAASSHEAAGVTDSATEQLISNALESAAFGDEIPITFPGPRPAPAVETFDETIAELPIPRLVEMGEAIIDHIRQIEPEVRINLALERGVERRSIHNHAGTEVSFTRSPLSMFLEISRVEEDDVLLMFEVVGSTLWQEDYLAFARQAGQKLELARKSATIRSGRMPVLFAPGGALVLGLPLMLGLDGKNVYKGTSPMGDKVGQPLFDEKITVSDDATVAGRFASAPYDDEGVAHRRNVLIERGVVKGFLYDLRTAAQSGVESTGNGSRSLFSLPAPSPTNLLFAAGTAPLADLIAGIDEGLLVEDPLGLGQGNVISGAFSNSLGLAFKIERGEIVGRVKDVSIAGNIYDLLQDVSAVSQETEWIYYNFRLPYILLPEVNVVAKQ